MKNIHLIPTDKPSRLSILNSGKLNLGAEVMSSSNSKLQHIYITFDEKPEDEDWYLTFLNREVIGKPRRCEDSNYNFSGCKKIILTTDQDLIKDGVQAIDDKFLEWFVKNPSCEWVEITKDKICQDKEFNYISHWNIYKYKIVIPKEEPKQETTPTPIEKWVEEMKGYKEITGFETPAELLAYEKGREHEEKTIVKFIQDWKGETNSVIGQLLADKVQAKNEKLKEENEMLKRVLKSTDDSITCINWEGEEPIRLKLEAENEKLKKALGRIYTMDTSFEKYINAIVELKQIAGDAIK
jgi:hypothetical protein